jgi:hypothetical protein
MAKTTDKEFTVVGVSKLDGQFKVRYANSVKRAAVLAKNGHTDIFLIELELAGRKEDCVDALLDVLDNENDLCAEARECILAEAKEFGFCV